jgi:hypothetical protein
LLYFLCVEADVGEIDLADTAIVHGVILRHEILGIVCGGGGLDLRY